MANCTLTQLYMPWMLVASASTTVVFVPAGPWVSASGVTGARGWGEMRSRNGNVQVVPAIQLTNDVHDPGTPPGAFDTLVAVFPLGGRSPVRRDGRPEVTADVRAIQPGRWSFPA